MFERDPIIGKLCDQTHPFPAPDDSDWMDSMEYGAHTRLPVDKSLPTEDRDTTPTWRALGAYLWERGCLTEHIAAVAADPFLTTHIMAVASIGASSAHFDYDGIVKAMRDGGLAAGYVIARDMPERGRVQAVTTAVHEIMRGASVLRYDIGGNFPVRG
ncbi:hypothetical protein [Actinoplanes sp. NPDC051494]|uniref:hypothetical protein n=1 Tax=Actinoplanes sp. NPDC051494 TaxID=3363907 RepID=UPI0037B1925D